MEAIHIALVVIHVLLAALIFGMVFYSFILVFKTDLGKKEMVIFRSIAKYGAFLVSTQLLVGVAIVLQEPEDFKNNPLLFAKVGLFIVAGLIYGIFIEKNAKRLESKERNDKIAKNFKMALATSVIVYGLIIILGVVLAETA